jgi:hypothetical protein
VDLVGTYALFPWGVATQLCPQLPPQSGISYVSDYIDLIVDDFFSCTEGWEDSLACQVGQPPTQRFGILFLDFSQTNFFYNNIIILLSYNN